MTAAPPRPRPRPTWREPRFIAGLLLVIASAAGMAGLVSAVDRTEEAFTARHVIAAGDELTLSDLRSVHVRLGAAGAAYLAAVPTPGTVATRTITRGELVPLGALATAAAHRQTSVVISVNDELPTAVTAGATVDVWAATAEQGPDALRFGEPRVLAGGVTVVRVGRDNALGGRGGVTVEIRVPKGAAAALLAAITNGAAMKLLPVGD